MQNLRDPVQSVPDNYADQVFDGIEKNIFDALGIHTHIFE
mgnify:CR=1 FL=1